MVKIKTRKKAVEEAQKKQKRSNKSSHLNRIELFRS